MDRSRNTQAVRGNLCGRVSETHAEGITLGYAMICTHCGQHLQCIPVLRSHQLGAAGSDSLSAHQHIGQGSGDCLLTQLGCGRKSACMMATLPLSVIEPLQGSGPQPAHHAQRTPKPAGHPQHWPHYNNSNKHNNNITITITHTFHMQMPKKKCGHTTAPNAATAVERCEASQRADALSQGTGNSTTAHSTDRPSVTANCTDAPN